MKEINQLTSTFNSDVSTGDFYEFIYLPDAGTNVVKNSEYIDTIPGIEFKKAFFGIWISNNPIQKNLKKSHAWKLEISVKPRRLCLNFQKLKQPDEALSLL